MKTFLWAMGAALAAGGGGAARADAPIVGEYAEARSLAIYAGACHYNGEVTTAGAEAILAWKITSGTAGGVDLKGLSAVAVIEGEGNLSDASVRRRTVLYVDSRAGKAQRDALAALVGRSASATLGTIAAVKSAPIAFTRSERATKVTAGRDVCLDALAYPCEHCHMEHQVWYSPLAPGVAASVAQGLHTGFTEKILNAAWQHEPTDNVYLGTFRW